MYYHSRTTKRAQTFHDGEEGHPPGILHLPMDTPYCADSRKHLERACKELGYTVHPTGWLIQHFPWSLFRFL